jgi:hypothetical protein
VGRDANGDHISVDHRWGLFGDGRQIECEAAATFVKPRKNRVLLQTSSLTRLDRPRAAETQLELQKRTCELDHARVRGTKRTGTLGRECPAGSPRARLKLSTVSRVASEMAAAPLTGVFALGASALVGFPQLERRTGAR